MASGGQIHNVTNKLKVEFDIGFTNGLSQEKKKKNNLVINERFIMMSIK